jgi:hypothetical protein
MTARVSSSHRACGRPRPQAHFFAGVFRVRFRLRDRHKRAMQLGFSDTFAVIGIVLIIAGIAILLTGKPKSGATAGGRH